MSDIVIPDYLNEDADTIHARMLAIAPADVTTIEGDMYWDCTRPDAEEKSRLEKIQLQNILKMAFTQSATGVYLEYLGECKNVFKSDPTYSTGKIQVTGKPGTQIITNNTLFGTVSTSEKASIQFKPLENVTIDGNGNAEFNAQCVTAGTIGNVAANTITLLISNLDGIKSVNNGEVFSGGTDIEDEEHYRERVITAEQEEQLSGADSDYERWALEVDGVGYAYVIAEWNGPGTVKVLVLDANGQPATEILMKAVKDYIYPDKLPGQNRGGKAPIGAIITIDTATTLSINIKAKFIVTDGFSADLIFNDLKAQISSYLKKLKINDTVKFNAIQSIIGNYILTAEGIEDFESLTVNDGITNIQLSDQVAVIGEVSNIE